MAITGQTITSISDKDGQKLWFWFKLSKYLIYVFRNKATTMIFSCITSEKITQKEGAEVYKSRILSQKISLLLLPARKYYKLESLFATSHFPARQCFVLICATWISFTVLLVVVREGKNKWTLRLDFTIIELTMQTNSTVSFNPNTISTLPYPRIITF